MTEKTPQKQDTVQTSPKDSLTTRGLRLLWHNPHMARTLLREEYRKKFGIAWTAVSELASAALR